MDMSRSAPAHFDLDLADEYFAPQWSAPKPGDGISGAELRRRLITPEAIAAIHEEAPRKTLLQRLLRR